MATVDGWVDDQTIVAVRKAKLSPTAVVWIVWKLSTDLPHLRPPV